MLELNKRVAVVTGGASGIGAACAEELERKGATVVRWDLVQKPGVILCDVADALSVAAAIEKTQSEVGTPTLLVAAAGIGDATPILDMDVATWDRVFAVNLRGVMLSVQAVARGIAEAGLDGSMLAVSSVNGIVADPGLSAYSASKAAIYHFVRVAAREFGPLGIRINAIGPGPTDTPMLKPSLGLPGYLENIVQRTPLGGIGTPNKIAEVVVGVLEMEWVTGQALMADGGSSLSTGRTPGAHRHSG